MSSPIPKQQQQQRRCKSASGKSKTLSSKTQPSYQFAHYQMPAQCQQQQQQPLYAHHTLSRAANIAAHYKQPRNVEPLYGSIVEQHSRLNRPLCRCRVIYLGSSVPHVTKNGLRGIQEPLRQLYPEEQFSPKVDAGVDVTGAAAAAAAAEHNKTIDISHLSAGLGIDSWLSVWSNGMLLENVDEFGRDVRRFFAIDSLHYCAAVRFFDTQTLDKLNATPASDNQQSANKENEPKQQQQQQTEQTTEDAQQAPASDPNNNVVDDGSTQAHANTNDVAGTIIDAKQRDANAHGTKSTVRFLPLDAPLFAYPDMLDANHPPVFAAIMRRTTGIKVLECHAFICRRDAAANALVRCCTHAYADYLNAKRLSCELHMQHQYTSSPPPPPLPPLPYATLASSRTLPRNYYPAPYGYPTLLNQRPQKPLLQQQQQQHKQQPQHRLNSSGSANDDDANTSGADDNYASIAADCGTERGSRSSSVLQRRARAATSSSTNDNNKGTSLGSSRSLFSNFQPQSARRREAKDAPEALSLSLDQVQGDFADARDKTTSSDELKRHSKSMQHLRAREVAASSNNNNNRSPRRSSETAACRAASFHDIKRKDAAINQNAQNINSSQQQQQQQRRKRRSRRRPSASSSTSRSELNAHKRELSPQSAAATDAKWRSGSQNVAQVAHTTHINKQYESMQTVQIAQHQHQQPPPPPPQFAPPYFAYMQPQYAPPYGQMHPAYAYAAALAAAGAPPGPYATPELAALMYAPMYAAMAGPPVPPAAHMQRQAALYAAASMAASSATLSKQQQRQLGTATRSTLTRFRCLSPPAKLVGDQLTGMSGQTEPPESGAQQQQPQQAVAQQTHTAVSKKMSWIKRLSLTMSSPSPAPHTNPSGENAAHQSANEQHERRKKRSSLLFMGTLSMGRKSRRPTVAHKEQVLAEQQQQQQQQQDIDCNAAAASSNEAAAEQR